VRSYENLDTKESHQGHAKYITRTISLGLCHENYFIYSLMDYIFIDCFEDYITWIPSRGLYRALDVSEIENGAAK
jgi:hypothetical protein